MTALTADRYTLEKVECFRSIPVAAATKIWGGGIVMVNSSGYAVNATAATGLICVGRCEAQADNSLGSAGAISVLVRCGKFNWASGTGSDAVTEANIGAVVYAIDDQTVGLTNGSGTRSAVGNVWEVDADGVWVETRSWTGTQA